MKKSKNAFFEGWYVKIENAELSIAFIPAYHITKSGHKSASLQIIWNNHSIYIPFSEKQVLINKKRFHIEIDKNLFNEDGISLDIDFSHYKIQGKLFFSSFTTIKYDIMGIFHFFKKMQCNHGILSMHHKVNGFLQINDKRYDMNNANGYIEKDWGTSFPKHYLWTQCHLTNASIMLSIAHIPIYKYSFQGVIAIVYYNHKEYRFASYLNAKILKYEENHIIIKQHHMILEIIVLNKKGQPLAAPIHGSMNHIIKESILATIQYRFYIHNILVLDEINDKASYEFRK